MDPSEGNDITHPTQPYVAAKPSTAASQVDSTYSSHDSRHRSAAGLSGANVNDDSKIKRLEGEMKTGGVGGVHTAGDGRKGSEENIPPAKSSEAVTKAVKSIKPPRSYPTYLVPGINTEKHPYEAGDDNESLAAEMVSPLAEQ